MWVEFTKKVCGRVCVHMVGAIKSSHRCTTPAPVVWILPGGWREGLAWSGRPVLEKVPSYCARDAHPADFDWAGRCEDPRLLLALFHRKAWLLLCWVGDFPIPCPALRCSAKLALLFLSIQPTQACIHTQPPAIHPACRKHTAWALQLSHNQAGITHQPHHPHSRVAVSFWPQSWQTCASPFLLLPLNTPYLHRILRILCYFQMMWLYVHIF